MNKPQTMTDNSRKSTSTSSDSMSDMSRQLLSVQEAAFLCQVSERTITRWIAKGVIRAQKVGHRRLICRTAINGLSDTSIEAGQVNTSQPECKESLEDIRALIETMVQLYHPNSVSDLNKKRQLQQKISNICASHRN